MTEDAQAEFRATETPVTPRFRQGTRVGEFSPFETATPAQTMPTRQNVGEALPEDVVPAQPMQRGEPLSDGVVSAQPMSVGVPLSDGVVSAQRMSVGAPLSDGVVPARQASNILRATPASSPRTPASSASDSSGGGGAGQGFSVNPEQYRAAVSPMLAAAEQVAALAASLSAYLPGLEAQEPWGKDESGKQFAEGEKGYLKYSADTLKGLKRLPDGLKHIADGLKAMAEGYQGADESITSDFNEQDGQGQQPGMASSPRYTPPLHIPITPRSSYEHVNTDGRS
ncbi:hypothetical protein [Kitasatospora sp. HPMI-4]|uniref:hypothetical protein n=1 Tax=Kitasatospora sp. HPMI-4 TaxID=3448443 RepID=UPI003F1ACDBD